MYCLLVRYYNGLFSQVANHNRFVVGWQDVTDLLFVGSILQQCCFLLAVYYNGDVVCQ